MHDTLANEKRALRSEIRQRRHALGPLETAALGAGFATQLRTVIAETGARTIACYLSSVVEPSTRDFLAWAHDEGLTVLLPLTRADGLLDWVVFDGESERMHELGFPEVVGQPLGIDAVARADILFIPAAAVARDGLRLGWGRGYYDKSLAALGAHPLPPIYAVVYDAEVLDEVPREPHDKPVDAVVTQSRILHFTNPQPGQARNGA